MQHFGAFRGKVFLIWVVITHIKLNICPGTPAILVWRPGIIHFTIALTVRKELHKMRNGCFQHTGSR